MRLASWVARVNTYIIQDYILYVLVPHKHAILEASTSRPPYGHDRVDHNWIGCPGWLQLQKSVQW